MVKAHQKKITDRSLKIGVIGLGYVGLPLAVGFTEAGFDVTGIDVHPGRVKAVNKARSYILDVPDKALARAVRGKKLRATTDVRVLSGLDAVIICVPTPLRKSLKPDISYILKAGGAIGRHLKKGQLVVLESTTYPGTTFELGKVLKRHHKDWRVDRDFFLAFSPERVDPGNSRYHTTSIPKVIGGEGPNSKALTMALYSTIIPKLVPVSSARAAEMVKLLENTFRNVNIAFVNELAKLCHEMNVDVWEVIDAAKTKPFGFMPFYPGPGLGGHCIPIDPHYLNWVFKKRGHSGKLIGRAEEINSGMPRYVVNRVTGLLRQNGVPIRRAKLLILGVAYKKNVDDLRESPALEVLEHLRKKGARVTYSDPHVLFFKLGKRPYRSNRLSAAFLKKQDCVIILTDHAAFDYAAVARHARLVFDTRNAMRRFKGREGIFFL